jgi:Fic family protein
MKNKALYAAKKIIAQIITDVVNLEDINYTVPEVQTLIDGITVGGHKIQDELITLNQINAWGFLFLSIENKKFSLSKDFLFELHSLVAKNEALRWGEFRGGQVSISGTKYLPPSHLMLNNLWDNLVFETNSRVETLSSNDYLEIYKAAITIFAKIAKTQFFYDGNKRTARMIMSGILLSENLPMISIGANKRLEFNQVMINYYDSDDLVPIYKFFISCIDEWVITEYNLIELIKQGF